jgi:hypothetical protein
MDLEQLTKHQIVLLTLLVSFVTSIATGIVTVSLMNQAPPGVTKVVNQIVEHTIEKVVPSSQGAAATMTEKTVVVKDDDLAAQSIAKAQKSIIRIVAEGKDTLIARGVIIDNKGTALSDRGALTASGATGFEAILSSGVRVSLSVRVQTGSTTSIAILDVAVGTSTGFVPATVVTSGKLALGQTVIRIGGTGTDVVGTGVVAALPAATGVLSGMLEASVSSATPGALLISLFGEVIGIATTDSLNFGSDFYSIITPPSPPAPVTSDASQT